MRQMARIPRLECLEAKQLLYGGAAATAVALVDSAEGESELVPDFSLLDTNPNSATYNESISPRDFLGQTTAWYFGHAT